MTKNRPQTHPLAKTKLGEFLTMGCEQEGGEIGLYIASADVSASCAFEELRKLGRAIREIWLKRILKKGDERI